jgi:hypothetical protein
MVICRMCLFFDKLLILERLSGNSEIANMFKNILSYAYESHLLLCWMILQKVPNLHTDNKWYAFLVEVTGQKCYVRDATEAIRLI